MTEAGRNFGITVTETPTDDASRNHEGNRPKKARIGEGFER
jgi:hypothetical protein